MGAVALTFIVLIGFFAVVIYLVSRWAIRYVERVMNERIEAVDQIVNHQRVPDVWFERYITKIDKVKEKPNSQVLRERYINLARKRCIANLDELIRFTEDAKYADGDDAKRNLLASLRAQRKRWDDAAFWDEVFS